MGAKLSLPEVFYFSGSPSIANQQMGKCWWKIGTEECSFQDIFVVLFTVSELAHYFPLSFSESEVIWDF